MIGGHGSAPAKSNAKQTLLYYPLLEPFRRIFRALFDNLWIIPERTNFRHPVNYKQMLKIQNFVSVGHLVLKLSERKFPVYDTHS